jgi:NADPH-dependent curcumin reductase
MNKQIVLNERPISYPTLSCFKEVLSPLPEISAGQILAQTIYVSLDPYIRGRMNDAPSYAPPMKLGEVINGGGISKIIESKNPKYKAGDLIFSFCGWQQYSVLESSDIMIALDPRLGPPIGALGILGMPGFTAYLGVTDIGKPKAGETMVVSAAAGAVGNIAGQIGKLKGCRTVGIASGLDKCKKLKELGFDECVDRSLPQFAESLRAACPKGIDFYFENSGGKIFETVFPLLNIKSRVALCGMSSAYNTNQLSDRPDVTSLMLAGMLTRRILIQGFMTLDHSDRFAEFNSVVAPWFLQGKLKSWDSVTLGLENAPQVFIDQMNGKSMGKVIIQVQPL